MEEQKIVTTQKTSKKWKLIKLVSVILFFVGLILLGNSYNNSGAFLASVGFMGFVVGKFGAWWSHG